MNRWAVRAYKSRKSTRTAGTTGTASTEGVSGATGDAVVSVQPWQLGRRGNRCGMVAGDAWVALATGVAGRLREGLRVNQRTSFPPISADFPWLVRLG